ncbi:MAG: response regulator [Candidatus Zixiibacteriota bacterium]|nr:MAG: response regulator [candidate division Zixibacteria bacterium]
MTTTKAKILVVDDDATLLGLLVDTLTVIGYNAVGVPGGIEALEALSGKRFDLLITDIKMPGMDGIALSKKVRRHYPDLPVLFITGVATPEIIGRASPDGFLAKPFRINHIEELIENTLKNRPETVSRQIRKVMVVDDDQTFREMLADALRFDEYIPCAVSSGEEALRELERGEIDAVITDIRMPGMDGITLLKQIKERQADLPVILITAYLAEEDIKKQSVHDLADGFIRKPFRVEKIVEMLNGLSPLRTSEPSA